MVESITHRPAGPEPVTRQLLRCAAQVLVLPARRRLHLHRGITGQTVALPDGRTFVVYRDTTYDEDGVDGPLAAHLGTAS